MKELSRGKGHIYWTAYPVELSESLEAAAVLYAYAAAQAKLTPAFREISPLPSGILVYPTSFADAMVYVLVSDCAADAWIQLEDLATGVRLDFKLPSQHAAIALLGKKEKRLLARYGF